MRNFTYEVTSKPTSLIFTLDDIKNYLKIDDDIVEDDNLITNLYWSAYDFFESYTNRTLLNTQYKTYRDYFFYNSFSYQLQNTGYYEIKKSKLQSIDSIQYINSDGILTDVDENIYYNTFENDYSKILLNENAEFPSDIYRRYQAIEINFTAGYGSDGDSIPYDIKDCLLSMIASLYENRGDCSPNSSSNCNCSLSQFDSNVKITLMKYKILNI